MSKVSVIIPIYNCEKYLKRCIDSIINQTYKDLEIVFINDGSKDNSRFIIEQHEKKDSRIKLINQENSGVAVARNNGIKASTGEYIMFVDADDWLDLDAIEIMIKIAKNNKCQIVRCNSIKEYPNNKSVKEHECCIKDEIINKDKFSEKVYDKFINTYQLNSPWAQLIEAKVIKENNITFKKGICFAEDYLFNLELYSNIDSLAYTNNYFYHYFYNEDSATTINNLEKIKTRCEDTLFVYNHLYEYLDKWNINTHENKKQVAKRILRELNIRLIAIYKKEVNVPGKLKKELIKQLVTNEVMVKCNKILKFKDIFKINIYTLFQICIYYKLVSLYNFFGNVVYRTVDKFRR